MPGSDSGNMLVTGPTSVASGTLYDLELFWNMPGMMAGDRYYGAFSIGSDPGNPGNIATIPVKIIRLEDDVTKTASSAEAFAGDTITYTVLVQPNVMSEELTYMITDTIPTGFTYVPASAVASDGVVSVAGNTLTWEGTMQSAGYYEIATSDTDPACTMPLATDGAYVDLEAHGLPTDPTFVGNSQWWSTTGPISSYYFYGEDVGNVINFTEDGFAFFDPSTPSGTPWTNQPIPTESDPNSLMAFFWQDLEWVYHAPSNRGVTIVDLTSGGIPTAKLFEYDNVQVWDDPSQTYDMEFIVYGDGYTSDGGYEIIYAYDNIAGDLITGTIGVENTDGTSGTQFAHNDGALATLHDGMAICFMYIPPITPVEITYAVIVDEDTAGTITNIVEHQTDNPGSQVEEASSDVFVIGYGVELSGDNALNGEPGDIVTYTLQVTNTGSITDTFDIDITGIWTATTSVVTVTLDAGVMTTFDVYVSIPTEAARSDSDVSTVKVTSQTAPAVSKDADLTTGVGKFTIYLPLIYK